MSAKLPILANLQSLSPQHVILNMPNAEYHSCDAISKSGLDRLAVSPKHYRDTDGNIGAETARIGTLIHAALLENGSGLVIPPDIRKRSRQDRDDWRGWFRENGADIDTSEPAATWFPEFEKQTGMTIATTADVDTVRCIQRSLKQNELAHELLRGPGHAEVSLFGDINGVECRTRPDFMRSDRHCLVDVKSVMSAQSWSFRNSCARYRYHVQQAMYCTLYHTIFGTWPDFYFVAVEKQEPYSVVVYELDADAIGNGIYLMERDLRQYALCKEYDTWTGLPNIRDLSIPIYEPETFDLVVDGEQVAV